MSVYLERKTNKYMFDYQCNHQRFTESGFKTKAEAKEAEAESRKFVKSQNGRQIQTGMGFSELVNLRLDWLLDHRGPRHYTDTKYIAKRWVRQWGHLKVDSISSQMVETYLAQIKKAVSVTTANKELRYLKSLFNYGCKAPRRWFNGNPTDGLEFYSVGVIRERYVPPVGDVLKVMLAATQEQEDYLWTIALTMARMSEINNLEWKDIDFKNKVVILHTHKSKGGNLSARKIPMVPKLEAILTRLQEQDVYKGRLQHPNVFWHRYYSPLTKDFVEGPYTDRKNMMSSLCARVEVPYFRFHPLRHFGATMLERAGVPIRTIQMLLGHTNRATTEIYLHSAGTEERAAMHDLENVFETKVPEKSQKTGKGLQLFGCNPL